MFDAAWKALACYACLLLANTITLLSVFYHTKNRIKALNILGWLVLLAGNLFPLTMILYTAARAGRVDGGGLVIAAVFGLIFILRVSVELGSIGKALDKFRNSNQDATNSEER